MKDYKTAHPDVDIPKPGSSTVYIPSDAHLNATHCVNATLDASTHEEIAKDVYLATSCLDNKLKGIRRHAAILERRIDQIADKRDELSKWQFRHLMRKLSTLNTSEDTNWQFYRLTKRLDALKSSDETNTKAICNGIKLLNYDIDALNETASDIKKLLIALVCSTLVLGTLSILL